MSASFPAQVRIIEVGPRDGLQNELETVPVSTRVRLVDDLAAAGLKHIEAGSFVSPRRVPQMVDSEAVFQQIRRVPGVVYSALVPNLAGLERALACQADEIAVFVAASEAFSQANLQCSIAESFHRVEAVASAAKARALPLRGYVSCVLGCPFSGAVPVARVTEVAGALHRLGCREVSLGDTIGTGTPKAARAMVEGVASQVPLDHLAVHFHDTWGQALANIFAVLETGIAALDSSVAGLGGCPYAPGATGNVATEDVLYMLHGMGIETGVNLEKVSRAGAALLKVLGRRPVSRAAQAWQASQTVTS